MFVGHLRPEKGGAFPAFMGGYACGLSRILDLDVQWICIRLWIWLYIYIYNGCSYTIVYVMEN